jgi:hypothetical protein
MLSTAPQVQGAHYPLSVRLTRLIMTPSTANHDAFARLLRDTESRT